jgi:hypothetical protein
MVDLRLSGRVALVAQLARHHPRLRQSPHERHPARNEFLVAAGYPIGWLPGAAGARQRAEAEGKQAAVSKPVSRPMNSLPLAST